MTMIAVVATDSASLSDRGSQSVYEVKNFVAPRQKRFLRGRSSDCTGLYRLVDSVTLNTVMHGSIKVDEGAVEIFNDRGVLVFFYDIDPAEFTDATN